MLLPAKLRSLTVATPLLLVFVQASQADFTPIPLATGSYNQEMIVPATAPEPAVPGGYTTATMDNGTTNTSTTWYEEGYNVTNPASGLPHPGTTFISSSSPNHQYTMPLSYTANNALMLDSALSSG
ncbi:MAG TPA: hypothetical protein VNV43_14610, partial [Candidatus Acidoferrales bacterium]|nr:hypothetical protein [Candidatus Acidoferrales bacterium]